jgi:ketosteroid isomerase-like protein
VAAPTDLPVMSLSAEDRLTILDLVTRADDAATRRDRDVYLSLFTDDAVLDGTQGTYRGRAALDLGIRSVWTSEADATVHLTLNPYVDDAPDAADVAIVHSILLILSANRPGQLITVARITQHVRCRDGHWRIHQRTVNPLLVDPSPPLTLEGTS